MGGHRFSCARFRAVFLLGSVGCDSHESEPTRTLVRRRINDLGCILPAPSVRVKFICFSQRALGLGDSIEEKF